METQLLILIRERLCQTRKVVEAKEARMAKEARVEKKARMTKEAKEATMARAEKKVAKDRMVMVMVCKVIAGTHKAIGAVILHMVKEEKEAKTLRVHLAVARVAKEAKGRWVIVMACRVIAGAHKAIGTRRSKCRECFISIQVIKVFTEALLRYK